MLDALLDGGLSAQQVRLSLGVLTVPTQLRFSTPNEGDSTADSHHSKLRAVRDKLEEYSQRYSQGYSQGYSHRCSTSS